MNVPNIAKCVFPFYPLLLFNIVLQAFRQRKLAESGAAMGYGGSAV